MSKYIPKKHYRDSVRWPDGVRRDIPTCMAERRDLPDGEFLMTDNTAKVDCKRCLRWMKA